MGHAGMDGWMWGEGWGDLGGFGGMGWFEFGERRGVMGGWDDDDKEFNYTGITSFPSAIPTSSLHTCTSSNGKPSHIAFATVGRGFTDFSAPWGERWGWGWRGGCGVWGCGD